MLTLMKVYCVDSVFFPYILTLIMQRRTPGLSEPGMPRQITKGRTPVLCETGMPKQSTQSRPSVSDGKYIIAI